MQNENLGRGLAQVIAEASFTLWKEEEFRKIISFNNLSQEEQDRIFNELQVSFLGLLILQLDRHIVDTHSKDQQMYHLLRDDVIDCFLQIY